MLFNNASNAADWPNVADVGQMVLSQPDRVLKSKRLAKYLSIMKENSLCNPEFKRFIMHPDHSQTLISYLNV